MDIRKILQELKDWVESEQPIDHIVFGVNQGRGTMLNRIFNSEKGTKDTSGQGLGGYSNSYARFRQRKGRQVEHVDLELTGSLRRNIQNTQIVRNDMEVAIAIPSVTERDKVFYLEKQYKKDIFSISDSEQKSIFDVIEKLMSEDIMEILKSGSV